MRDLDCIGTLPRLHQTRNRPVDVGAPWARQSCPQRFADQLVVECESPRALVEEECSDAGLKVGEQVDGMKVQDLHQKVGIDDRRYGGGSSQRARGCPKLLASGINRLPDGRRKTGVLIGDRQLPQEQRVAARERVQLHRAAVSDDLPGRREVERSQRDPLVDTAWQLGVGQLRHDNQKGHAQGA